MYCTLVKELSPRLGLLQRTRYVITCVLRIHHQGGGSAVVIPPRNLKNRENHPTENPCGGVQPTPLEKNSGGVVSYPEKTRARSAREIFLLILPNTPSEKRLRRGSIHPRKF